ncbi:ABC transporter permease [Candidatus Woesearchaeota archaeon]|nr:ABC transporter permease [Candidatus Woesearchaeota archaeon]
MAISDFKLRNEGTYLGFIWYLLNPILLFIILLLIFQDRLGSGIESYGLYLLMGIIMFNFFQKTSLASTKSILNNASIIKSIKFQRKSIIISVVIQNILEHIFEIIIFTFVMVLYNQSPLGMIFYPLIFIVFIVFTYGVSLILASLTMYFHDIHNMWNFLLKLLWFATPIFYGFGGQTKLLIFNLINPLYYFIKLSRDIVIYNTMPPPHTIFITIGLALISLLIGIVVYDKLEKRFAEML